MPDKLGAGDLARERMTFQSRGVGDDGFGNAMIDAGPFEDRFTVSAHLRPLRGSETVIAARLQGRQPYIITVRQSSDTRQANEAWRIVDTRNHDRVFAIKAPPTDPDGKRAWLEILCVLGEETEDS